MNIEDLTSEIQMQRLRLAVAKAGPPGPPPRPGLEWNEQSSRWIRPQEDINAERERIQQDPQMAADAEARGMEDSVAEKFPNIPEHMHQDIGQVREQGENLGVSEWTNKFEEWLQEVSSGGGGSAGDWYLTDLRHISNIVTPQSQGFDEDFLQDNWDQLGDLGMKMEYIMEDLFYDPDGPEDQSLWG